MIWQIGEFDFDEMNNTLTSVDSFQLLEPKTAAVLSYFCRHPQQDISREVLLDEVWNGQIVSDGAINRVVLKLRKAFNDEDKVKKYFVTVPKVGYRFIGQVSQPKTNKIIDDCGSTDLVEPSSNGIKPYAWLIVILFIAAGLYFIQFNTEQVNNQNVASPLTRLSERQFDASLSHDERLLAYSMNKGNQDAIFVVDTDTHKSIQVSKEGGWSYSPSWSLDDSELIYLYFNESECQFHRVKFSQGRASEPESVYNCLGRSFTRFVYDKPNQKLYFSERASIYAPYHVYELDLNLGNKRKLSQPLALGRGNYYVGSHPESGHLLMLSEKSPGKTTAYDLLPDSDSYNQLLAFDYVINSAVWSHDGGALVHPAKHPSYHLVASYIEQSKEPQVLVADSNRVSYVGKVNNGKDYLYTSYMNNRDVFINGEVAKGFNSSVMDYLPSLSPDGQILAFISKRSGYSKIWLYNRTTADLLSIEPPDQGRTFFDLLWSENGQQILANTDSGIILFDAVNQKVLTTIEMSLPTYGVNWADTESFYYSHFEDQRWQLYQHNLNNGEVIKMSSELAFAKWSSGATLLVAQDMSLRVAGQQTANIMCEINLNRRVLNLNLDKNLLYCFEPKTRDLMAIDLHSAKVNKQDVRPPNHYSVSNGDIAWAKRVSGSSDIIRTNFN